MLFQLTSAILVQGIESFLVINLNRYFLFDTNCEVERMMEMKVLTDYEQLVGKTIAFSYMAQFGKKLLLLQLMEKY